MSEKKAVTAKVLIDLKRFALAPLFLLLSILIVLIFGFKFIPLIFGLGFLCVSISFLLQRHLIFDSDFFYLDGKRFNYADVERLRIFSVNEKGFYLLKIKNLNTGYFLLASSSPGVISILFSLISKNQKLENFKLFFVKLKSDNPKIFKK